MKWKFSDLLRLVTLLFTSSIASVISAQELRLYEFVLDEEYTFASDCDVCGIEQGTRGRVTGQFSVLLDPEGGTGKLQTLDARIVNVETLVKLADGNTKWESRPDRLFLGETPLYDPYRPPLPGVLETFPDRLELSNNGTQSPSADMVPLPELYRVIIGGNEANFSFTIPILDLVPRITSARANLIATVPEPECVEIALAASVIMTLFCMRMR